MDLDPLTQADRWPAPDWFAGVLRTADLFGQRVTLLDVQVLDGGFLLRSGPAGVTRLLGRDGPERVVHVTARAGDLGEALRDMALDDSGFTAFEWSCLRSFGLPPPRGGSLRGNDSRRLRACAVGDVPRVLAAELQSASPEQPRVHQPTGSYLRLARAWESWIEAGRSGDVPVHVWESARFDLAKHLAHRPRPRAETGLVDLVRTCTRRSDLRRMLHEKVPHEGSRAEAARASVEWWWLSAYFAALAEQHRGGWLALTTSPVPNGRRASPVPEAVQLEGRSVDILGRLPAPVYATLRHRARRTLAAWAAAPSQRTADAVGYALRSTEEEIDLYADRNDAWRRLSLAIAPAVAGVLISTFGEVLTGLWVGLAGALGVLIAIPLMDLVELHKTRPARMRAYLHMPGLSRE